MDVKGAIKQALSEALKPCGISVAPQDVPLEFPAELSNGDYATGVALKEAKSAGMKPRALAEKLVAAIGTVDGVSKIEIADPGFINFHLAPSAIAESVEAAGETDMWGANSDLSKKKIMVEYTDPNPFKEFHIGHLMSNAIGESLSRLLQFSSAEVKRANYQGDVGPHVAKAIWGKMQKPELSWGEAYAYGTKNYEANKDGIDSLNAKIYDRSDGKLNTLYDVGRKESLEHFEELYKILGTKFDFCFFESETAPIGVALVKAHPDVFVESDGAIVYKGEQDGLHTRVFITSKGLPTYETKDLGLAQLKSEKWPFDSSITVTAQEQADYFAVVLAAMKKVLPKIAPKIKHVSHGMMRLTTGKMSSRTGDVITGESLLNDLIVQAKVRAAESRSENKDKLAQDVAVAAIKYQILKQASGKDITFDRERALSLEGDSGPYLQYAHARTQAILAKAKEQNIVAKLDADATPGELSRLLHRFPEVVERAAREYEPHMVTNYLLQIASEFNSWYAKEQILDGTPAAAHKVAITAAVARTLKNGSWLLGIPTPEKM
ncbi:MAG TPA: arginine--tRNA ligase [Candidatus Paceibacterota bacterium]|nr:arginine--tRNA ligase [Candidatus Paceibacterota bacterium]